MDNQLTEKIHYNSLFDIYGLLLTDKQREYFQYYYSDDYSLSEIAELYKVSRNAVFDQIKKAINHLEKYEEKLNIWKQKQKIETISEQIKALYPNDIQLASLVDKIEKTE
ncbi:MAG: YlxM family DNA-binding protein [Candidatus Izemoplasmatales bacterium]|nr:YlxM family DNA-binding protein [Candidatus Izemoplasmatales bacterium]MDD4595170.1 YlxM family DNA-binding protein [Candidatus Izemoplasmatales bacterium]